MARIGLISDTHGLLRPEAIRFLAHSDRIVHAGDIVDASILDALGAIAPVTAVRGNNDRGTWAEALAATEALEVNGVLYVNPGSAGPRRFRLPIAAAELLIEGPRVAARWVTLEA